MKMVTPVTAAVTAVAIHKMLAVPARERTSSIWAVVHPADVYAHEPWSWSYLEEAIVPKTIAPAPSASVDPAAAQGSHAGSGGDAAAGADGAESATPAGVSSA